MANASKTVCEEILHYILYIIIVYNLGQTAKCFYDKLKLVFLLEA